MINHMNQLESFSNEKFISRFDQISTIEGIHHALSRSIEVKSLNSALREEAIGDRELDWFIRHLLSAFVPGEQFRFQINLAGIAVACETINKAFARQFIDYLAGIQLSELSVAAMVARYASHTVHLSTETSSA